MVFFYVFVVVLIEDCCRVVVCVVIEDIVLIGIVCSEVEFMCVCDVVLIVFVDWFFVCVLLVVCILMKFCDVECGIKL